MIWREASRIRQDLAAAAKREEAAGLLDVRRASISDALTGKTGRGPVAGALEYLYFSWSVMTPDQREQVRRTLKEVRAAPAINPDSRGQ